MKTLFSTRRAYAFSPNEMLLTPRMVFTSGSSCLMRRTAASVSIPAVRYSSWPVEMGRVRASNTRSTGRIPYLVVASSKMRLAIATFLSAVSAMPCSSMVSAMTPAP
jgi:hypothetical protein